MPAIIEAEQLTKSYGRQRGIIDVDLVVNEGEAFGFLGPNGAGKTTTIRTLLVAIIGPALKLPEVVQDLALSAHYGLPMVGQWEVAGIVASLVLAIGGVAIGAWGFTRRDLGA